MNWRMIQGDCREVLRGLDESSVDAVVTDPPYELGFMGKKWDASGIAYNVSVWRELLRGLKPGAHLLAFGGTRTYHRMACAIEDAGFEIRDSIHWLYGTGFPKSLNLGDGRGTALKPGHEPIVLARKPLDGTVAANVMEHGTGALNIDGCRIGNESTLRTANAGIGDRESWRTGNEAGVHGSTSGRWPANVLLDEDAAAELDAQAGERTSGRIEEHHERHVPSTDGIYGTYSVPSTVSYGDTGGASRFFYVAKPTRSERDAGLAHLPGKTAGQATDRKDGSDGLKSPRAGAGRTGGAKNHHPTVKPVELMRYLCRLITPPGGLVLDPFTGSGTTGIAALQEGFRFLGIDLEPEYARLAIARIEEDAPLFNRQRNA